jgi:hypothetical protein
MAIPIFYLFIKNRVIGIIVTWALLFGSLLSSYIICDLNQYHLAFNVPGSKPQPDYMDHYYNKPWIRSVAYLMGILYGFAYLDWKLKSDGLVKYIGNKIINSALIRVILYLFGLTAT